MSELPSESCAFVQGLCLYLLYTEEEKYALHLMVQHLVQLYLRVNMYLFIYSIVITINLQ